MNQSIKKIHASFSSQTLWVCVFLWVSFTSTVFAQNIGHGNIPDSLVQKSFQELRDIYYPLWDANDTINVTFYINAHIKKAKLENDRIEQANGYLNLSHRTKRHIVRKYVDSAINITKDISNTKYPALAYLTMGNIQYSWGEYEEALKFLLLASKYADTNHIDQVRDIKKGIAALKHRAGQHKEVLQIDLNMLKSIESQDAYQSKFYEDYTSTLFNLSIDHLYINQNEQAEEYINLAIKETLKARDSVSYYENYSTLGEIKYRQKSYIEAIQIFSECIPQREGYGLANLYTFRGKSYWDLNDKQKAILDFEKADSILHTIQDFSPEILEVYATLNQYYRGHDDQEKQIEYIDKLMYVDSILDADALYLTKEIKDQYDIPMLLAEWQEIIDGLEGKTAAHSKWLYGLSICLVVSFGFGYYYFRRRGYKKKFEDLMAEKGEKKVIQNLTVEKTQLNMAPEIVETILKRLEKYEKEQGYLQPNISLQSVSKQLETNSNYLSKIINVYRFKNFSSYIGDLRVAYVLEELKNNTQLRNYTIKAIATEVGFGNAESFTKAFKKKTGIYPSYYIKRLNTSLRESR